MAGETCAMCELATATKIYGMPVCDNCERWLVELDERLKAMEAADPELAELGRRVEAGCTEIVREAQRERWRDERRRRRRYGKWGLDKPDGSA